MDYKLEKLIATRKGKQIYKSDNYCVKLFDTEYFKISDILNEALNHARVEETDLNIPKIEAVTQIDGKWAIVIDYVEGKTLDKLMEENPKKIDEYLEKFVDLQLEMHTKKAPLLNKLKDKMNRKISASGLNPTIRYELHIRVDSMPKHTKLCHGDFNPSNIILGDDGKCYLIDWSHATQGNAASDAARAYLLFKLNNQDDIAEKYLKLYCKKSDTARQYIEKWIPIVAAARLSKNDDSEKAFLSKWVNIMDFE